MQKKIIALAVAGLVSGAAFAQTNVTVYGNMDVYFGNINPDGAGSSTNAIGSSGVFTSRLGFKGEEALGNGLAAYFQIENKLDNDVAAGLAVGTSSRQSLVGLKGGFGAVQMGKMSSLSHAWSGPFDYAGNFTPQTVGGLRTTATSDGVTMYGNAFAYLSPSFSGLTVGVARIFDEATTNDADVTQLGANYANGPIAAAYVWTKGEAALSANERKSNFLAASYNFGVVKLIGEYTNTKTDATGKGKFWTLGVVVPVSAAGNIHAGYGKATRDGIADNDTSASIAYTHGLSKRTTAYVGYMKNGGDAGLNTNAKIFAVGMNHAF